MFPVLDLRYSGPQPRPLRRAAAAGGAEPWARTAAAGRARTEAAFCRRATAAIADLRRAAGDGPSAPGLGLLTRRLARHRHTAEAWRAAAAGTPQRL